MIVPVKKIRLIAPNKDKDILVRSIQRSGKMMLFNELAGSISSDDQQHLKRIEKNIVILEKHRKKKFFEYHEVDIDQFNDSEQEAQNLLDTADALVVENEAATKEKEYATKQIELLTPYVNLSVAPADLIGLNYVRTYVGYWPTQNATVITDKLSTKSAYVETLLADDVNQYVAVIALSSNHQDVYDTMAANGFVLEKLPELTHLVADEVALLEEKISTAANTIETNDVKLKELSDSVNLLKMYYDYDYNKILKQKVEVLATEKTVYIEGWVAEDELEAFGAELSEMLAYDLEILESTEEEKVPTVTRNNRFVRQFETITNMFSVPDPNEIDPNPVMSVWYWFIFGIMMGDVGYGIVLITLFSLFVKFKRPKGALRQLAMIFAFSGVSAIIFGVIFGSFFGYSFDLFKIIGSLFGQTHWTSVVVNPMEGDGTLIMLVASLVIGVLHILNALVLKVILEFRRKNYVEALNSGISWILILLGISLYVLDMIDLIPLGIVGLIMIGIGAVLIIIFSGYGKKGIFSKAVSAFGGLYGASGYLSDILSYSRILALSLSSGVIAFTMNMLAGMVSGSIIGYFFAMIILIVGHFFNFAMGLLSAYVHDGRLQYLEFFGKFYEGDGLAFTPFTYDLKYIDKINKEKK
ncbi:MAG: V-type ATP synthase subunit I [Acholeplasmataceae bacterium]